MSKYKSIKQLLLILESLFRLVKVEQWCASSYWDK